MKTTTKLKLESLIRRLIREESSKPKYIISYETDMGLGTYGSVYTNFETAIRTAEVFYQARKNKQSFLYVGVEPRTHGDRFAIIYATSEFIRNGGIGAFDNQADKQAFTRAALQYIKTKATQAGTYPSSATE